MQKKLINLILFINCCLLTGIAAAGDQSIHIQWGYTPPTEPAVAGYRLYQEGVAACETQNSSAYSMDCMVSLVQDTTNFTLTALFSDGSESPHSTPFPFTVEPEPDPPITSEGSHAFTFLWEPAGTAASISKYNIYLNNTLLCQSVTPTATSVTCNTDLLSVPMQFSMTTVDTSGTESSHSNLLTYDPSLIQPPDPTPLSAVITATTTKGEAPLTVGFDAASSTGDISSYNWAFGDGSTSTVSNTSHIFSVPGSYSTKLTIADSTGATSTDTVVITVTEPPVVNTAPTAVISSSTTSGDAPLPVNFSAASSSDPDDGIASYSWNFGDGSTATGVEVSHTYSTAGTYTATLTVTDTLGLSDSASTPVVISEPPPEETNTPPTAVIAATSTSGSYPLSVTFSATGSSDSDGSITSYFWNFGDGSTATGPNATHTYTTEANFVASLQVTDDKGDTGSASTTITVTAPVEEPTVPMEIGEVAITGDWTRVQFSTTFSAPIVIAGPPTYNDGDAGVVRLRNIDPTGFDIKFSEWDYLDGTHTKETVSYLVIEKGNHVINGTTIEAGSITGTKRFSGHSFTKPFADTPVVMTAIASYNSASTIGGRLKNVTSTGFEYYFREQEASNAKHPTETVHYIAIEQGSGSLGPVTYEAATTGIAVTHDWKSISYKTAQSEPPYLLADMQTHAGRDTSALRIQNAQNAGFEVKVEEEQSKDSEVSHDAESIGYLAITSDETLLPPPEGGNEKSLTFSWEFEQTQEGNINGFRVYNNDILVCETTDPSIRELSCTGSISAETNIFVIRAVDISGTETDLGNPLSYHP